MPPNGRKYISFAIPKEKADKLEKELPKYGDRSRLLQWFIDRFLEGKIDFVGVKRSSRQQVVN